MMLAMLMSMATGVVSAYDFEIDGIYYYHSGSNLTVTSGTNTYSGDIVIPETITHYGETYSVTSIGNSAFNGCTGLTSVKIPNSVTSIGYSAFYGCTGLTSIEIPNSVNSIGESAFSGCRGLTSVIISEGVTSIGYSAFQNCTRLTSIEIPNSVTSIGEDAFKSTAWYICQSDGLVYASKVAYKYKGTMPDNTKIILKEGTLGIANGAFRYCMSLTSIEIPNSVTSIGDRAFTGCGGLTSVIISEGVTSIGYSAFEDCSGLTSVTIGNSVTEIGSSAFRGCSGLTSVTIPESVTSIGHVAFSGCTGLTSLAFNAKNCTSFFSSRRLPVFPTTITTLTIGDEVKSIPAYAFYGCTGLTSVTIPNSVTSIGEYAFDSCSGLTSIHITDLVAWCRISFSGAPSNPLCHAHHLYLNDEEIKDLVIPESVTSIGEFAFKNCSGLTSVTIPGSVTKIGSAAFSGCSGLTSVTIPNSVTSIGDYAFSGCSGLTSITIPNSVASIDLFAFEGCTGLMELGLGSGLTSIASKAFADSKIRQLLIKADTPPAGSIDVFSEQTYHQTTLYVPINKKDDYAYSDSWYKFNTIKESATANAKATSEYAYTLMEARTFQYAAYDAVNDRIKMVAATSVDENNPNHCWQTVEMNGKKFLYNIGAKKFAVPSTDGSIFRLSAEVGSISMEDGDDGIIIGGNTAQQWALVVDEKMDAYMGLEDVVATGVENLTPTLSQGEGAEGVYDLSGRRIDVNVNENVNNSKLKRGIYIKNGRKILIQR